MAIIYKQQIKKESDYILILELLILICKSTFILKWNKWQIS